MKHLLVALLLLVATAWSPPGNADTPPPAAAGFTAAQRQEIIEIIRGALKSDPSILREAVQAMQADDATQKAAAARTAIQQLGPRLTRAPGDPVAGNPDGDVTVVEFYDLRCPYCRRMLPVLAELLRTDPKVRLVYKDIPILGPASTLGARAVLAAQKQDGYQRLHDEVMAGSPNITEESLHAAATHVGLDWTRLQHDMDDPAIQARLDENLRMARMLGVDGTPVYLIGSHMLPGALDVAELHSAIQAARMP